MSSKLYIEKMLTVSTGHYTESDDQMLEAIAFDKEPEYNHLTCWVMPTGHGFIVWVSSDSMEEILVEYREAGFSEAFCNMVNKARELDCNWVRFDCDVPSTDGFQTFDW